MRRITLWIAAVGFAGSIFCACTRPAPIEGPQSKSQHDSPAISIVRPAASTGKSTHRPGDFAPLPPPPFVQSVDKAVAHMRSLEQELMRNLTQGKMTNWESDQCIRSLGKLRSRLAIPELIRRIDFEYTHPGTVFSEPPSFSETHPAAAALIEIGSEAVPPIVDEILRISDDALKEPLRGDLVATLRDGKYRKQASLYSQGWLLNGPPDKKRLNAVLMLQRDLGQSGDLPDNTPHWIVEGTKEWLKLNLPLPDTSKK